MLEQIGCEVSSGADEHHLTVAPPTWRPDLTGPAHYGEVARLVGYDEITSDIPTAPAGEGLTTAQRHRRDIARALSELGLDRSSLVPVHFRGRV